MTDFTPLLRADRGEPALTLRLVDKDSAGAWLAGLSPGARALASGAGFDGAKPDRLLLLPADGYALEAVAAVRSTAALTPWCLAKAAEVLPAGSYRLANGEPEAAGLGWMLAQHRFDRYRTAATPERGERCLLTRDAASIASTVALAEATATVRDMIDTPAADMGPADLEAAVRALAERNGATVVVTVGDALAQGYPMIAAVGAAAERSRAPRLVELHWGREDHPRIAVLGKGVCFDTGGLDIKSAAGMRLMKKDMGGAAHAIALAGLVMARRLPVRLHLLVPAVENSIASAALRPGDVIVARNGLTVEVDNTDAEGRLVLGDALVRAGEDAPALMLDFATLTGAARVALGPDLPATFVNDEALAADLLGAAAAVDDPLWRMPLWDGYDELLKSQIADLANSADSPMAGAVTAALFLRRFVPANTPWAHLDTFAWRGTARPGRPKGGEALGLRAAFALLASRYGSA